MRKLIIILTLLLPSICFGRISIFGGQAYGSFRLAGAGSTNFGSLMIAGIKFSEYADFRYMSLDTSLRMPVLPFRIVDAKYDKSGGSYTYYDSDVFGLSINIPFTSYFKAGFMYGLGKAEISRLTELSSGKYSAVVNKSFLQAVNIELVLTVPFKMLIVSPSVGVFTHFLDSDTGYDNALSCYAGVSVSYSFQKRE